jgi:nitrogen PTS system EIIA component
MRFLARLRPELVQIDPPWRTFDDTIAGLVDTLVASAQLPAGSAAAAIEAVLAREAEASTALLDIHTGIPHGRLPLLTGAAVALAVSPTGLYEAVPTVPIQIVALVVSPPETGTDHLETIAGVATLLRSAELRGELLAAQTGTEALAVLRRRARPNP